VKLNYLQTNIATIQLCSRTRTETRTRTRQNATGSRQRTCPGFFYPYMVRSRPTASIWKFNQIAFVDKCT